MRAICWSVKGGSGTTVVAAVLALEAARGAPTLCVDLAGDLAAVLGVDAGSHGVHDWLAATSPGPEALDALVCQVTPTLRLLTGDREPPNVAPARVEEFVSWLQAQPGSVVVDLGVRVRPCELADRLVAWSDRSLLVARACYLALRRAIAAPLRADGVVFMREEGRRLNTADVEASAHAPILATIDVAPVVARAVEAGLLNALLPRLLTRPIRALVSATDARRMAA